ncbi:MAG: thiamine-phosphate diphosphorylase [Betaproteobacteria bacterium RBG_16_64_9]|nr:MAG: thiamine-phosphate diphosphorylase [Betaproteobacteria bacterium RBG_16_64_9]
MNHGAGAGERVDAFRPGRSVAGLYAITPEDADTDRLERRVQAALAGGASLVQYRSKSPDSAARRAQGERLLAVCRRAGAPLIVNDDLELALAIGADGVHLGRDDGDVAVARARLGADRLLGVSCYDRLDLAIAAVAAGADHVAFGSAFASLTKPEAVRAPPALFAQARARLQVPIVAIGGITPENAHLIIEAGADAVAVITALFDAQDVAAAAAAFRSLFQRRRS